MEVHGIFPRNESKVGHLEVVRSGGWVVTLTNPSGTFLEAETSCHLSESKVMALAWVMLSWQAPSTMYTPISRIKEDCQATKISNTDTTGLGMDQWNEQL